MIIDLCCGKGGWYYGAPNEEWIGYDVVDLGYPGQLILQDIRTIRGDLLKDADFIVASPPCTEFSCQWTLSHGPRVAPPSLDLVRACIRIAQEAKRPIVLENVGGLRKWMPGCKYHAGPFYLWGDIPILPDIKGLSKRMGDKVGHRRGSEAAIIPYDLARSVCDAMLSYPTPP